VITLSQVKELELRVGKVLDALRVQSAENASLKERISELEARLDELGKEISSRMSDEKEIEAGLQSVFDMLDRTDAPNEAEDGETQPGNDSAPIVNGTKPNTESFAKDSNDGFDTRTVDEISSSTPCESDSNSTFNEGIRNFDNSKPEDVSSSDAEGDRFQNEFDIF